MPAAKGLSVNFLDDELLSRIHERAAQVDADNAFPEEDFADLKAAGYYKAFVPTEFGGAGLTLQEIAREQTRLAQSAPATALAINMHQIIVGLGRHLVANGVSSGEQILRDGAAGVLFAFGISEPANDLVLFGSLTEARPDGEGGKGAEKDEIIDRKSTRLNSSHVAISYAVCCLKKKI